MCKTTPASSSNTTVSRIYPACPVEAVSKTVRIKIYDPKHEIQSNSDLNNTALQKVKQFYNGLKSTPGLDAAVKTDLEQFTFDVTYIPSAPNATEKAALGRMDFPFYIFTHAAANLTSVDEVIAVMEGHQIAQKPWLRMYDPDPTVIAYSQIDVYSDINDAWKSKTVLGIGNPAVYTGGPPPGLVNCRKLGFIKIDALLNLQSPYDTTINRFAWVLEHELGHMLALAHKDSTMMNSQYDRHFNSFDPLQITYIRDTLKILSS